MFFNEPFVLKQGNFGAGALDLFMGAPLPFYMEELCHLFLAENINASLCFNGQHTDIVRRRGDGCIGKAKGIKDGGIKLGALLGCGKVFGNDIDNHAFLRE